MEKVSKKAALLPPPPRAKDRSEPPVKSRWPDWASFLVAVPLIPFTLGLLAVSYLVDMQFMGPQPEASLESIIYLRAAGVTSVLAAGLVLDAVRTRLPLLKWLTKWLTSHWMRRLILVGTVVALVTPIQRLGGAYREKREADHAHEVALEATSEQVDELEVFLRSLAPANYQTEERGRDPFVARDHGSIGVEYQREGGRNPEVEVRELHGMLYAEGAQLEGVRCDEVRTSSPIRVIGRHITLFYNLSGYRVSLRVDQDQVDLRGRLKMQGPIAPDELTEDEQDRLLDEMAVCLDFLLDD